MKKKVNLAARPTPLIDVLRGLRESQERRIEQIDAAIARCKETGAEYVTCPHCHVPLFHVEVSADPSNNAIVCPLCNRYIDMPLLSTVLFFQPKEVPDEDQP